MPITPRIDIAQPMVGGGKARPPVNWKIEVGGSFARAVERKTSQREVKALLRVNK